MLHHVLFIGNSHTYYNYMPQMLSMLVKSENRGFEPTIDQCTGEGAGLAWHWKMPPHETLSGKNHGTMLFCRIEAVVLWRSRILLQSMPDY